MCRVVIIAVAMFVLATTNTHAASQNQDDGYPRVAKNQSRPQLVRLGNVTTNLDDDPCDLDPTWCNGGGGGGGGYDPEACNCKRYCYVSVQCKLTSDAAKACKISTSTNSCSDCNKDCGL